MPQYLPGSEAFVDAILEREKSKPKDIACGDTELDKDCPFIVQYNYKHDFMYLFFTISAFNHEQGTNAIGQWRPKSFKPKYYETAK